MVVDGNGFEILWRSECLALLESRPIGRVAFTRDALPAIVPVTYHLAGRNIVFATVSDSRMVAALHQNVVALEVDSIDSANNGGWSVVVVGVAQLLDEGDDDLPAARRLNLQPWLGQHDADLFRLSTNQATGRRLAAGDPSSPACAVVPKVGRRRPQLPSDGPSRAWPITGTRNS
jgi:hypothetical protein